jgi:PAS domain S-box-containing protein/putative nucleotidyltransferase with HDIG domain
MKKEKMSKAKSPDADEKLKETTDALCDNLFLVLAENSPDMIILMNPEGIVTYANPIVEKFLGYKVEENIGAIGFDLVHPDDLKSVTEKFNILTKDTSSPVLSSEIRVLRKDGNWHTFETVGSNLVKNNVVEAIIITHRDINERKKTEEALRKSEERYRELIKYAPVGIYEIDYETSCFKSVNDIICEYTGYTRDELLKMSFYNLIAQESQKCFSEHLEKLYAGEQTSTNIEYCIRSKSGKKLWVQLSTRYIYKDGKLMESAGIIHDITEHKKAEELIKKSEEKYRLLADHMKDFVWLMDLNLIMTYISPSVEKILGYTLDEITELPLDKLLKSSSFKAALDFFSEEMPKALAAPPDYVLTRTLELECICKDGQTLWVECMFSLIRDELAKPISLLGEARNITERKQMEYELRASETNFHHSLDDSPLGVRISTLEAETIYANKAIFDIYGYDSIEELKSTSLKERYTTESYAQWQERKAKRLQGELGPSEYEISIVRKDGEIRHLHVFRKEIFWNGEKQSQVIYQDITERKQAEEKLRRTLENLRQSIKTTIQVLGMASEAKDPYTAGHHKRVANLARAIAKERGLSPDIIEGIRMAGSIHDIGKLSVPAEILTKPARLTDLEFSMIKEHAQSGYEMLKNVESPWPLAEIIYQHHERMNGTGYPRNLKEDEILMAARIMAVADVVEAMSSHRPYRASLGVEAALEEIEKNKGTLYDAEIVDACLRLFRDKGYTL